MVKKRAGDGYPANIVTLNYYQQQLAELFRECPDAAGRARNAAYTENALRNAFIAYNRYKQPSGKIAVKQTDKGRIGWGVMAGWSANSYHFSGEHWLSTGSYRSSGSPLLGLFLDVPFSRSRQQLWLNGELFYKRTDISGRIQSTDIVSQRNEQVNLEFSYVQLNLLFRYMYLKGTVRPFVNVGVGNAFAVSEGRNEQYAEERSKRKAVDDPRKHEQSILAGLGARYGRLQGELRYAGSNGFSSYSALNTGVRSWQVIVKYQL